MILKYLNGFIPISFLINISSAVYYQSTNQFLNNNIYPKRSTSSSNWIPTGNYNQQQQQQQQQIAYLPITSEYTQNKDITSDNNKVYENYFSDIYGQSSSQKPIITNENDDFHQNQKLLLKSSSPPIQPYGQQQKQQESMVYSTENLYPFYLKNKNVHQQQQQPEGPSSFHKLSPAITLISEQEQQQQQHNSHNNYRQTESMMGKIPAKSIMSLSSEQNTGYGFGINGYNDGKSEQYSQNINNFQQQQQQHFIPDQYTTTNYQASHDRQKSDYNKRSNLGYPSLSYENNDNSYQQYQQSEQPYTNLNINSESMNLKNVMQEYTIYMENQLKNQKQIKESNNNNNNDDDGKPSASKYYQYLNNIVQSNERNKLLHTPYTSSINISSHLNIPSGSNLIDSQQQQQYINNIDVPSKTIYYQPHEIILTTSKPPSLSSLNPTSENVQYQNINYYHHQPAIDHHHSYHNTGRFLHNYYTDSDRIKSIGQLSDNRIGGHQISAIAAISSNSGNAIPISKHVQVTKHIPIPIYKQIHIPIKHPVKINISQPVIMAIPKPYPIQIPITKPIVIPMIKEVKLSLDKIVPYPVEKNIPYMVEKHIPYTVEKYVRVPIVKPYPVKVPIIKTVLHKSKVHNNNNYFW